MLCRTVLVHCTAILFSSAACCCLYFCSCCDVAKVTLRYVGSQGHVAENSDEYKFWNEICLQSVQNNVLQLDNGAQCVSRDNTMTGPSELFVRPCYYQLISLIMNQTSRNAVITGTPGIGKTMLRNVLVHTLIRRQREHRESFCIVLDKSPGNDLHVFKATVDTVGGITWSAHTPNKSSFRRDREFPAGHPVWYLLDVSEGRSTDRITLPSNSRTIMFTSPDEAAYKEFIKEDCVKYLMPLWSKGEAFTALQSLTTPVAEEKFSARWEKYGGVARALFASDDGLLAYDKRVGEALVTLDTQANFNNLGDMNNTPSIKHLLFYLDVQVDGMDPCGCGSLIFGTDYIKKLVLQSLSKYVEQSITAVMSELGSCATGSLKGLVLEPIALKLLCISEKNFEVTQMGGTSGGLQLNKMLSFAPMTMRADANTTDTFIAAISDEMHSPSRENILLVPRAGLFPVVDAVAIVGDGDARCCLFLQVTGGAKHPVTGPEAAGVFERLIEAAGGADKCALVFVLPNNLIFTSFKAQKLPEDGTSIRQYKIALKTETTTMKRKVH
jgi:hypothetical protein